MTSALSTSWTRALDDGLSSAAPKVDWRVTRRVNRVIDGSPESHQILVRALGDPS